MQPQCTQGRTLFPLSPQEFYGFNEVVQRWGSRKEVTACRVTDRRRLHRRSPGN